MTQMTNEQKVRALRRVISVGQRCEAESEAADYGFSCGEFRGDHHWIVTRMVERARKQLGLSSQTFHELMNRYMAVEGKHLAPWDSAPTAFFQSMEVEED